MSSAALHARIAELEAENARLRETNELLQENRALRSAAKPVVPPMPLDSPVSATPAFRAKCADYGKQYKAAQAAYRKLGRDSRSGARFPRYVKCETDTDADAAAARLREFAQSLNLTAADADTDADGFTSVRRRRRRGGRGRDRSRTPDTETRAESKTPPPPEIGSFREFPVLKAPTADRAPAAERAANETPTTEAPPPEISGGAVSADPLKAMLSGLPKGTAWADAVDE